MLDSQFKEAQLDSIAISIAPASSAKATELVLEYVYSREIVLDGDCVMEVLAAADMLQVKQLKQACINYLDEELSCENACTVLRACRQLELADVTKPEF